MFSKSKARRAIKNLSGLIKKNKEHITRIILSEEFSLTLKKHSDIVEFTSTEKDEIKIWFLFGVEAVMSNIMRHGCALEMKNGEFVVIKDTKIN